LSIVLLTAPLAKAQHADDKIDPDKFDYLLFNQLYLQKINTQRIALNRDELIANEVLEKAALDQSDYMAKTKKINLNGSSNKKRTTGDRIAFFGGTNVGLEIVQGTSVGKDVKTFFTYNQVVEDLFAKIAKSKKYTDIINNPAAFYIGIGASTDANGKKIAVSIVVGGLESINEGKNLRKLLNLRYTTKTYGIKTGNVKECRNCERFDDFNGLQQGMSIQQGKIYFEYGNLRKLKKLFVTPEDGIAIDIVLKAQYPCDTFNIYDGNRINRGILLKPIYGKDLLKNNSIPERENRYVGFIAEIPKSVLKRLGNEYELNVNVIQRGSFCKRVVRTYNEGNIKDKIKGLTLLPDTAKNCANCNISDDLIIDSVKNVLTFRVPFDKNKSEYKLKDMEPLLNALNEPKYTINEINLIAYTSMEGDSVKNAVLQIRRAKSMIEAIKKYNNQDVFNNIETYDAWEMFKEQVRNTERYIYGIMPKKQLIDTLNSSKQLRQEFEYILQEERVTVVKMHVTYLTEGDNELPFLVHSIQKALEKDQASRALRIQKYTIRQCIAGRFDPNLLLRLKIPMKQEYLSMHLNNIYLESRFNKDDSITPIMEAKLGELAKLDPSNLQVKYDRILAFLKNGYFKDQAMIDEYQNRIDALHKTKLNGLLIEGLYMEYLFKIIAQFDSSGTGLGNKNVVSAMEKLKKQFAVASNNNNWENALLLSDIFIKHGDYKYASQLLIPYLRDPKVSEKFIFTYISVIGHYPENWYTPDFRFALTKAKGFNQKRYCQLFSEPYLSIQVLEHPLIKKEYCETCR
jgi:hypothetical protein